MSRSASRSLDSRQEGDDVEMSRIESQPPHDAQESDVQIDTNPNLTTMTEDGNSAIARSESVRTIETVVVRNLGTRDVAALILNKMIGTGIFTTPTLVLSLTGSKALSVALWAIGGIHAALCLSVYLEFGAALPFTGGELIYLDELFRVPELLSTTLFAGFFILLGNTAGNSIAFAKYILLAAEPGIHRSVDLDQREVSFLAIVILSIVCLLHYFSSHFGLFLNRALALYKIFLLLAVAIAGFIASNKPGECREGESEVVKTSAANNLSALIYVLYSYQGWENANYVLGEIKAPKRTLRRGAILAITAVTLLYVLVTLAMYLACDLSIATNEDTDVAFAIYFARKTFGETTAIKVAISLSAFGNLVAVVFTSSKVKQAIANQRIIPFYRFLRKNDTQFKSPVGGLILHWIFTTILICITPSISVSDGYNFVIGLFTYGHLIIASFVGISALWMHAYLSSREEGWQPIYIKISFIRKGLALIFVGLNILIIIQAARADSPGRVPRYWWPIVFVIIILGSCIYWAVLRLLMARNPWAGDGNRKKFGQFIGVDVTVLYEGDVGFHSSWDDSPDMILDEPNRIVVYQIEEDGLYDKISHTISRGIAFLEKHLG